jgi:hypothetical protein
MKLIAVQFSPTSYHFILLEPKVYLGALLTYALSLGDSLNVRDQVPHQCKPPQLSLRSNSRKNISKQLLIKEILLCRNGVRR